MGLSESSAPAQIINTTDAKAHLRVSTSADDSLIDALVVAARKHAEHFTGRSFVTTTWAETFDSFPKVFRLARSPLIAVSSISYVDEDGNTDVVSSSVYTALTDRIPSQIVEAYEQDWPTDVRAIPNAVTVTYTAGYGAASAVPADIIAGIKLILGDLYEHREETLAGTITSKIPRGAEMLLYPYRIFHF